MSKTTGTRMCLQRAIEQAKRLAIFPMLIMAMLFGAVTTSATADEGLESLKGGLFHRKGWISPEIHRKRLSQSKTQAQSSNRSRGVAASRRRSSSRRAARKNVRTGARRATSKPRVVSIPKPTRTRRSRSRIPKRVVRRAERNVKRAERQKTRRSRKRTRVASLGNAGVTKQRRKSLTGGSARVQWVARAGCLAGRLKAAINHVARHYGRVRVNSTCRSRRHNRRIGGARQSLHLSGRAADIRVFGNVRGAAGYLRRVAGGYKHYGGGLFHIDTGPKRTW